ncbi:MAG TPA: DUF3108 domain-containing protein [Bacteroidota bacterium]|nr:DUF3108 domain-containing protein [Bacteroidota bacterium]
MKTIYRAKKLSRWAVLLITFLVFDVHGQQRDLDKPQAISDTINIQHDTTVVRAEPLMAMSLDTLRKLPNEAFKAGEYLKFDVNFGFITAGEAVMAIADTSNNFGRKCFKINFSVDSKPFFNWIYKVEDRYLTIVDTEGLFPWRFEQHIREGGYSRDFVADFDQINHIAKTTEGEYPIPPYVHDIMSAFYFARTVDYTNFKPGQKIHLQNFYKDSTYELDVKFRGRQQIEVAAGKFNCVIVEPLAREGGLFKSDGRVYVWLTDDERKIPIRVSTQIVIGSIDSELIEYRGIHGIINAKINEE